MILNGQVAVVTGGTSGIGADIVRRFTIEGADVVFNGRHQERGAAVAEETGATFFRTDVKDWMLGGETLFQAFERFGRVDILVNNAGGVSEYINIHQTTPDEFIGPFALHVVAAVAHIRAAMVIMRQQQSGSIINIASTGGHRGHGDGRVPYAVSKAALIALTHSLAPELRHLGVRINSISPGNLEDGIKVVADAVMFLAGDGSRFITGTDIIVDGGKTCGDTYAKGQHD